MIIYLATETNIYLANVYYYSIIHSARDVQFVYNLSYLLGAANETIFVEGVYLNPRLIRRIKNNNNKLVSFDINDHTSLSHTYMGTPECEAIDLFIKFSGLQKTNNSFSLCLDNDLTASLGESIFRSSEEWAQYQRLCKAGKIISVPYVPWITLDYSYIPFNKRRGNVLIRGGNHFQRYIFFLNCLLRGYINSDSQLFAKYRITNQCDWCKETIKKYGSVPYNVYKEKEDFDCTQNIVNWRDLDSYDFNRPRGEWNNRCIPMFYRLADHFAKYQGSLDLSLLEKVFEGNFISYKSLFDIIRLNKFYGDLKWSFSIFAPPRFWEAAMCGCVNLVPSRTNGQTYFPDMIDGEHYITYKEDFSDLDSVVDITEADHKRVANNCGLIYTKYIKKDGPFLSQALLDHIFNAIDRMK